MPAVHPPRTLWKHSLSIKWYLPVFTTSILRDVFSICSFTEIIQCRTCDGHVFHGNYRLEAMTFPQSSKTVLLLLLSKYMFAVTRENDE